MSALAPIRVLLADDHTILREGIRFLLAREPDIEVVAEAADGEEAVRRVDDARPDVVLLDIGMPRLNGLEATRRIKSRHPEVRVLVLTMHEDEEYIRPLMEAGASGYVLKRSAATELVTAIRAVHQGHTVLPPRMLEAALRRGRDPDLDGLTEREVEVLKLIAKGLTNQEIAEKLHISVKTVQAHRAHIMEKLDLHDAVELTKYALRKGLITLED